MCSKVSLVDRQLITQISKIMKFAEFTERLWHRLVDMEGECGTITKQSQKNNVIFHDVFGYVSITQQYRFQRLPGRQAPVAPYRHIDTAWVCER